MEEIIQTTITTTINEVIKNSNLFCFDWATLIISIISIGISIWAVNKNNKSNYKNNLYENVLKEALNERLPQLIQRSIDKSTEKVNDDLIDEFQDFLMELRNKILVYKYINETFYQKIDEHIIKIDDNIVLITNKKENFGKRYEELNKQIKELYTDVEKYLYK